MKLVLRKGVRLEKCIDRCLAFSLTFKVVGCGKAFFYCRVSIDSYSPKSRRVGLFIRIYTWENSSSYVNSQPFSSFHCADIFRSRSKFANDILESVAAAFSCSYMIDDPIIYMVDFQSYDSSVFMLDL